MLKSILFTLLLSFTLSVSAQITGLSGSASSTTLGSGSVSWTDGGSYYQGPISFYQFFAGSSKGAQNYYNSGSMAVAGVASPFVIPSGLPINGSTIWVRLWHKHGNTWLYNDTSFASFADPGTPPPTNPYLPVITSPTPASSVSSPFTLTWVPGNYRSFIVYAGLTPGSSTLENSGILPLDTTSYDLDVSSLAEGSTFWIRLWYKAGSSWKYIQASFLTSTAPTVDFLVTTLADSGAGSLRDVVGLAVSADGGTIEFSASLSGTLSLLSEISIPVTASEISITALGESVITISGGGATRLFSVASGALFTLSDCTLSDGSASVGGAINTAGTTSIFDCTFISNSAVDGGAINNTGTLDVTRSTFLSNTSTASTGGGIYNRMSATVMDSTFSGNMGSGILNYVDPGIADLTVVNSTFTGNTGGAGGGISNGGTLVVRNCTIVNNSVSVAGGGIHHGGVPTATTTIINSIIAQNSAGDFTATGPSHDLSYYNQNSGLIDGGTNYVGTPAAPFGGGGAFPAGALPKPTGTYVGTYGSPLNPDLAALTDNGGPTLTRLPNLTSPVLDIGDASPETLDQRGLPRGVGGLDDIGAVERQ